MRIGIMADGYIDEHGTLDYLKIILRGLYLRPDTHVTMFFPSENERRFRHYPPFFRSLYGLISPYQRNNAIEDFSEFKELSIIEYRRSNLKALIQKNGINVIFPCMMDLGKGMPVKWAVEFFDFQHKYYPQYFSLRTRIGRSIYFNSAAKHADMIFVNSQDAKKDVCKFCHIDDSKVEVLPFCASLGYDKIGDDLTGIPEKYGITKPYFLISNQFYSHKRHDVAFRALKEVREKGNDVCIVCTGSMVNVPKLIASLKQLCQELNIENEVIFLGVIPKKEQIELMKNAISVIQPSEFEGDCSGQIIDAITIGQRVIASDIDVIKEVSFYDHISFFKLNNVNELAEIMMEYVKTPHNRPSYDELIKKEQAYSKAFSDALYGLISKLV